MPSAVCGRARELLEELPPAEAMRRWMDLFGDWLSTKQGMIDTLRAMIETGQIELAHTRDELLAAITAILDVGAPWRAAGGIDQWFPNSLTTHPRACCSVP